KVLEHLCDLGANVALHELHGIGIERNLARQINRVAATNGLAVRANGRGRSRGVNRLLRHGVLLRKNAAARQPALRATRTTPGIVRMLRTTCASCRRSRTFKRNDNVDASPSVSTRTCSMLVCVA